LLDGYRTRLNGMSSREAEALFMAGLSGPAADLGLGAVMAAAQHKLLAALPAELRASAERLRSRFHFDAPTWFGHAEKPAQLQLIAGALWEQRPIQIRYRSWRTERARRIEPLGIVLKGGAWYLVGRVESSVRTYRVARIFDLSVLDQHFDRPTSFDLAAYWEDSTDRLERELHQNRATVRLSASGVAMTEAFLSPFARAGTTISDEADADGWRTATIPVGSVRQAAAELLRFGADAEVIAPAELRLKVAEAVGKLRKIYA
jgi:predicted DNA-binding transcriptional regulator YafY